MDADNSSKQLSVLGESTRHFGAGEQRILQALSALAKLSIEDAESLIRFHEALLFFRAYPSSARVLKRVEAILASFAKRVSQLHAADLDLSPLDDPEVSGIVGTTVTSNFSYKVALWLARKHPAQISIDWDWIDNEEQMGATLRRFLPLLADDAMVEAHVPFREWLRAATRRKNELVWLLGRFDSLQVSHQEKAELYDSLHLHVIWKFGASASRTKMKLPTRQVFFHKQPLIKRREISLEAELNSPPIPVKRLSRIAGGKILDLARETSAVRYRELHGFTYGEPARVLRADLGRGTEAFVIGVPPEHRLPLRTYHAVLIFKNGVPVSYFEGLSFFERMESGFNLYYTFREGETAWLFARILRLMRQLLGVTVFSIDPYQVGHENEEGIESGAFWFYRKLGFRPVKPALTKLAVAEERRLKQDPHHRTSARTLRKLAAGHMLFEMTSRGRSAGEWDRFEIRNIGLAVQRRMARQFDGDPEKIRVASEKLVRRALSLEKRKETKAFSDLSLVLALLPNVQQWSRPEKELAAQIISAKDGADESLHLKKMQKHASLRASLIRIGSGQAN